MCKTSDPQFQCKLGCSEPIQGAVVPLSLSLDTRTHQLTSLPHAAVAVRKQWDGCE